MMRASRFFLTRSRNTSLISSLASTSALKSRPKPGALLIKDPPFHRNFSCGNVYPSFGDGTGYAQSSAGTYGGAGLTNFTVFKGKAALTIDPFFPKFVKNVKGTSVIDRKGSMFLKFMPALGPCKYDYQKREVIALNPTELGCLISLDPTESCEFVHDPAMKSGHEGQIKKTLNVTPIPPQNGGYFFNLTINNSVLKTSERLSLPVTKAEFTVMRTVFSFALPYIMGWNQAFAFNQPKNLQFQSDHHFNPNQLPTSMNFNSHRQGDHSLIPLTEWEK